jgi:hypothetical protein
MSEQTFDERVAALEEHLVEKTAEEVLAEAERFLDEGNKLLASHALMRAKSKHGREQREDEKLERERFDEEDDDV